MSPLHRLLTQISGCTLCADHLPLGPRPVLAAHAESKIAIIGQAPGTAVHKSGIPWDDPSGDRLRTWLAVDKEAFYNPKLFAIVPMGFCYPGKGKSGDLPPRPECAPQWHPALWEAMPQLKLILLVGSYAQHHYLGTKKLTETVNNYTQYLPRHFVLPHPSPRNNIWMKKHPWFEQDVVPTLKQEISKVLPL